METGYLSALGYVCVSDESHDRHMTHHVTYSRGWSELQPFSAQSQSPENTGADPLPV